MPPRYSLFLLKKILYNSLTNTLPCWIQQAVHNHLDRQTGYMMNVCIVILQTANFQESSQTANHTEKSVSVLI